MIDRALRSLMLRAAALVGCALLAIACERSAATVQPPELIVRVSATAEVLKRMDGLRITAAVQDDGSPWSVVKGVDVKKAGLVWPVDIPVVPERGAPIHKRFEIVVEAMQAQVPFVQARAVATWFDKGVRILELELTTCADTRFGALCGNASTCHGEGCKACVNGTACAPVGQVAGSTLLQFDPSKPAKQHIVLADAGSDAAVDVTVDAGRDASADTGMPMSATTCAQAHGGCDALVSCKDVGGKAVCGACPSGYSDRAGDGHTCTDIDECAKRTFTCQARSSCVNTDGSYQCPCDPGYHGDGRTQCLTNPICNANGTNCDSHAGCVEVQGTTYCQCKTGYTGDGASCALVDCHAPTGVTNGSVSTPNGTTYSQSATYSCNPGYSLSSATALTCQAGATWSGPAPSCGDTNECTGSNVCTSDDPCVNFTGCYTCRGQFADWAPADSPTTFAVNTDGTVSDSRSGLLWQGTLPTTYTGCSGNSSVAGDTCTWAEAKTYCSGLWLAGPGWRLPTKAELESIVDFNQYNPAIDLTAFPSTPASWFWSSSPWVGASGIAWFVYFRSGGSNNSSSTDAYRVRCVR